MTNSFNTPSATPHLITGSEFRQYSTLDPATPVEIEEYSDLYDDYLDSPSSNRAATMNSGAAIYEQSTSMLSTSQDLQSNGQEDVEVSRPERSLNDRNKPFVSDDSIDDSFIHQDTTISSIPPIPNMPFIPQMRTPDFAGRPVFHSNDKTPTDQITRTPLFTNSTPDPRDSVKQSYTTSDKNKGLGISDYGQRMYNTSYSDSSNLAGDSQGYDDVNNSSRASNDNVYYTPIVDDQITDDDSEDDEIDDDEAERLLMQARRKNQQLYNAPYRTLNENTDDAVLITNSPGQSQTKIVRKGIKDFKIGKELGEGSYSTVVLGTDINNGKQYAIKILNKRHIIKEKKVKYVNIEKNALNRLGKRNGIVGLHFTFQDSQSLYFVLDFAENGELLALIKKFGTMNDESTRYYTIQMVDAISYMHESGIIHRDLKPENILIDKNFRLQITDFGTAKLLDKDDSGNYPLDTRANSFVGTAEYVSPELLNDKYCGKAADVWALGCIVYQMIAGKPPFKATNEYLTFQKIQKLQYAFTAGFPLIIRDLIKRILILKPRERLTIPDIKSHMWFNGINWCDENQIWGQPPPLLGPYKISAKAMKPLPELALQYPNGSSTSIQQTKRSNNTKRTVAARQVLQTRSTSSPAIVSMPTAVPNATITGTGTNANSPSAAAKIASSAGGTRPVGNTTVSTSQAAQPKSKQRRSASSAAAAALYGNATRKASSSSVAAASSQGVSTSNAISNAMNSAPSPNLVPSSPLMHQPISAEDMQQVTADRIIKSRQQQQQQLKQHQMQTQAFKVQASQDVIPGTNIPRPVLNTKIASRSNTGIRSRNNSSLKAMKKSEVPQMSVLDLKWVQFLKHSEERVMKVGIVEASREDSTAFEKKHKGYLIESPLGYKNKDNISQPQIFSDKDDESIRLLDVDNTLPKSSSSNGAAGGSANGETDSTTEGDSENGSSVAKFRKFFTVKQPVSAPFESSFVTRTMLITTFGRVLLFHENYGVDNKLKYEITTEIDLTNTHVHFVEVVSDKRLKPSRGLYAIMSNTVTICIDVEKAEITQWTQCLANSRMMEKERRLKEYMHSSNNVHTSLNVNTSEETAHAAATLASVISPTLKNTTTVKTLQKPHKTAFPTTLRDTVDDNNGSSSATSGVEGHKKPPTPNRNTKSKSTSKTSSNGEEKKKNGKTMGIGRGPMITAAINKAVSMAGVNAAVGARPNGEEKNKVTSMNSKFLARSRMR